MSLTRLTDHELRVVVAGFYADHRTRCAVGCYLCWSARWLLFGDATRDACTRCHGVGSFDIAGTMAAAYGSRHPQCSRCRGKGYDPGVTVPGPPAFEEMLLQAVPGPTTALTETPPPRKGRRK